MKGNSIILVMLSLLNYQLLLQCQQCDSSQTFSVSTQTCITMVNYYLFLTKNPNIITLIFDRILLEQSIIDPSYFSVYINNVDSAQTQQFSYSIYPIESLNSSEFQKLELNLSINDDFPNGRQILKTIFNLPSDLQDSIQFTEKSKQILLLDQYIEKESEYNSETNSTILKEKYYNTSVGIIKATTVSIKLFCFIYQLIFPYSSLPFRIILMITMLDEVKYIDINYSNNLREIFWVTTDNYDWENIYDVPNLWTNNDFDSSKIQGYYQLYNISPYIFNNLVDSWFVIICFFMISLIISLCTKSNNCQKDKIMSRLINTFKYNWVLFHLLSQYQMQVFYSIFGLYNSSFSASQGIINFGISVILLIIAVLILVMIYYLSKKINSQEDNEMQYIDIEQKYNKIIQSQQDYLQQNIIQRKRTMKDNQLFPYPSQLSKKQDQINEFQQKIHQYNYKLSIGIIWHDFKIDSYYRCGLNCIWILIFRSFFIAAILVLIPNGNSIFSIVKLCIWSLSCIILIVYYLVKRPFKNIFPNKIDAIFAILFEVCLLFFYILLLIISIQDKSNTLNYEIRNKITQICRIVLITLLSFIILNLCISFILNITKLCYNDKFNQVKPDEEEHNQIQNEKINIYQTQTANELKKQQIIDNENRKETQHIFENSTLRSINDDKSKFIQNSSVMNNKNKFTKSPQSKKKTYLMDDIIQKHQYFNAMQDQMDEWGYEVINQDPQTKQEKPQIQQKQQIKKKTIKIIRPQNYKMPQKLYDQNN